MAKNVEDSGPARCFDITHMSYEGETGTAGKKKRQNLQYFEKKL